MSISRWMDKKAVVHYTMEYYSVIKKNTFESVLMRWMKLEPILQSEVSQKEKHQYSIIMHIYAIKKDGNDNLICKTAKETQMYRTVFWTLWERERVGWFGRMALKHVYHIRNELPVQVRCRYRMLGAGALGWPRETVLGGRWEGGSVLGTRVHPWWIHVDVWQNQ